jgi:hypothetical protein
LGKDIDNELESRIPAAFVAYQQLLKLQSGAYTIHTRWVPENQAAGEIIRVSMIEGRSQGIRDIESFEQLLEINRERIRRADKASVR